MNRCTDAKDTVHFTPSTWIAFFGALITAVSILMGGLYKLHTAALESSERLIRVEMSTGAIATGLKDVERRVERLERNREK